MLDLVFWRDKNVLITGHTGFKGAWLTVILNHLGAKLTGYALPPVDNDNLFKLAQADRFVDSFYGDVEDYYALREVFNKCQPEIVLHLAAQPLVSEGYDQPRKTFLTNAVGTLNLCECIRQSCSVKSFLNVTTDKVYRNNEWSWGYREIDELGGSDPYSGSKSCSELITLSYKNSFLQEQNVAVSTARAGNVIGGGDFSPHRILPDCVRAAVNNQPIKLRNPASVRPYQHVLEALIAYLMIVQYQYKDISFADSYNIGPEDCDCVTTGELVDIFCHKWADEVSWIPVQSNLPPESKLLKLDCSLIKNRLGWIPKWHVDEAVERTIEWVCAWRSGKNILSFMEQQIEDYIGGV